MGNCFSRLPGVGVKKTVTLPPRPPSTVEASRFHSTVEECVSSLDAISGARSCPQPKSEYFSARVELMMQTEDQFPSVVAREIAHSKVHWSQVSDLSGLSDDTDTDPVTDPMNVEYEAEVSRENEQVFAELMNDPQWDHPEMGSFFLKWPPHWHLGRKIAEGGQAEIFEVIGSDGMVYPDALLKVFKHGYRLSDLRRQWPHGILRRDVISVSGYGTVLDDGRFSFVMTKCWGDLRKLIDQAMRERNNQGPPFPYLWNGETWEAEHLLLRVAMIMFNLHDKGILHRDLKAANVLMNTTLKSFPVWVGDFECSIGVMGTTFWRAPEILAALKNRSAIEFSKEADVYSFGMICFEMVTGRLPFEGELEICQASYDLVMEGRRPKLPSDLRARMKELIEACWDPIPKRRPTFREIFHVLDGN